MEKHELPAGNDLRRWPILFVLILSSRTRLKVISDEGSDERLRNRAKMHAILLKKIRRFPQKKLGAGEKSSPAQSH